MSVSASARLQLLVLACLFLAPATLIAAPAAAFVRANVIPLDGERLLTDQTVIIKDGRITALGPARTTPVPPDAEEIDAAGKFLIPGLADMHVHLAPGEGDLSDPAGQQLRLLLANGVTTVRGMLGQPQHLKVRDRIKGGEILGPRLFCAGPPLHGKAAPSAAAGSAAVLEQQMAGFDFIKVHEGLSPETYFAIVEAARGAKIPIAGHVTASVGLPRALKGRQTSIEHLDNYLQSAIAADAPVAASPGQIVLGPELDHVDPRKLDEMAAATQQAGIWNTPTLALFERIVSEEKTADLLKSPELRYVPAGLRGMFQQQKESQGKLATVPRERREKLVAVRRDVVKRLAAAQARLLVGSDSPQFFLVAGFATHDEIASLRSAGLSNYQALAAATREPSAYLAHALGIEDDAGVIAAGKRADLVLLDANPLDDLASTRKISGVMIGGRWLGKESLARLLDEVAAQNKEA